LRGLFAHEADEGTDVEEHAGLVQEADLQERSFDARAPSGRRGSQPKTSLCTFIDPSRPRRLLPPH
jgi:hypothetical protein